MNFTQSILLTVIFSSGLFAPAMAADDPAAFQADKESRIANILAKIQVDQKYLSCLQAAQDHAALKVCDEIVKQDHDILEPKAASEPKAEAPTADKKAPKEAKNKGKK